MGRWSGSSELFILFLIAASTYVREIEDFMCTQVYEATPGSYPLHGHCSAGVWLKTGSGNAGAGGPDFPPFLYGFSDWYARSADSRYAYRADLSDYEYTVS